MIAHKTAQMLPAVVVCTWLSSVGMTTASSPAVNESAPKISSVDQRFLTQLIRRTLEGRIAGSDLYTPSYVPSSLKDIECQIVVTLREFGVTRFSGISGRKAILDACQEAALRAATPTLEKPGMLARLHIDVQALGNPVPYSGSDNWTNPGALERFLDPGVEGVMLFLDQDQHWFTPAELISSSTSLREALRILAKETTLDPQVLPEARLSKFDVLHWWETDDQGHIATLVRGMIPIDLADITAARVDRAIEHLGQYLIYRQTPSGRFAYEYNPAADRYATEDDEVAQSAAAWAVGLLAVHDGNKAAAEAFDSAITERASHRIDLNGVDHASFLTESDNRNRLGITALACLAFCDGPDAAAHADDRLQLVNAMRWLQRPTGLLVPAFPPAMSIDTQDRFPGMALLALARCYELDPSKEILAVLDNALPAYRDFFETTRAAAVVPWHSQAFAIMARCTRRRDFADFVFALDDLACSHQLTPDNCTSPELWGAVVAPGVFEAGAPTAQFLQGLAAGAALARATGDAERFERYRAAARLATRFVIQLMFRPQECFFVRSPKDTLNGIRNDPINNKICIDDCSNALIGLIKARRVVFSDSP